MASAATAEEIQRAVLLRADELEIITENLRGQLGPARGSLHAALTLAGSLPQPLRATVARHMAMTPDPNLCIQILTPLLRHLNLLLDFVENDERINPGIDVDSPGGPTMEVIDPFSNTIRFCQTTA